MRVLALCDQMRSPTSTQLRVRLYSAAASAEGAVARMGMSAEARRGAVGARVLDAHGARDRICEIAPHPGRMRPFGIDEFSLGGGLCVAYTDSDPVVAIDSFVKEIAGRVTDSWSKHGLPLPRLALEPGRSISARAGGCAAQDRRDETATCARPARRFLHLDGGMTDNIRPVLYGARYSAVVANRLSDKGG